MKNKIPKEKQTRDCKQTKKWEKNKKNYKIVATVKIGTDSLKMYSKLANNA